MSELLLSIPEAAVELGVSASCVAKWADDEQSPLRAINQSKGKKRRRLFVTQSSVDECKKHLEARKKDRASRRPKPKAQNIEACLPAVQGDMFVGIGIVDTLEKLLGEQKKTNEMLARIQVAVAAIQNDCCDIESNIDQIRKG